MTSDEQNFVELYRTNNDATLSALLAGLADTEEQAAQVGALLLSASNIQSHPYVRNLLGPMTREEIQSLLSEIAHSDMGHYLRFDENGYPFFNLSMGRQLGTLRCIQSLTIGESGQVTGITLHHKTPALEVLLTGAPSLADFMAPAPPAYTVEPDYEAWERAGINQGLRGELDLPIPVYSLQWAIEIMNDYTRGSSDVKQEQAGIALSIQKLHNFQVPPAPPTGPEAPEADE